MIVANQHDVGRMQSILNLLRIKQGIVAAERVAEFPEIFAAAMRILRANFALHARQRRKLCRAASQSQIGRRGHKKSASSYQLLASPSNLPRLDFCCAASLCSKLGAT